MHAFSRLKTGIKKLTLLLQKRDLLLLSIVAVSFAVILIVFETPTRRVEYFVQDIKNYIYSHFIYTDPDENMVILEIDTETLNFAPYDWPWPHHYWAELIEKITERCTAKALILDIFFQGKKEAFDPIAPFAEALKNNGRIGLVAVFEQIVMASGVQLKLFPPEKPLRSNAAFWGTSQMEIGSDGKVRSFLLCDERIDRRHVAWELCRFLNEVPDTSKSPAKLPRAGALMVIRHPAHGFPRVSLKDLVDGSVDAEILAGKIAVLGATAQILHDFHETCFGILSGPDMLCNAILSIRDNRLQIYAPSRMSRLIALILGVSLTILLLTDRMGNPVKYFCMMYFALPPFLIAFSFLPDFYPPVGLAYIAFVSSSALVMILMRLARLAEIGQSLHEAEVCGTLQKSFFPAGELAFSKITCSGRCKPCQEAGGDYFDYFKSGDEKLFFILGDAAGHGIPASMISTSAKTIVSLRSKLMEISLPELFGDFNAAIHEMTGKKLFFTAVAGIVDRSANKVRFAFAGHLPAILRTPEGTKEFASPSLPLGMMTKFRPPKIIELDIPADGFLVLYSDGIIEALNWHDRQFGFPRIHETISKMPVNSTCSEVIDGLFLDLESHVEERPLQDDVTILVICFNPKKELKK